MAEKDINWWLMKSEPNVYGIEDLKKEKTTLWDGIRNYQARNFMRTMQLGDKAFFYHSNCKPPGIVGLMEIIELNLLDPTQFDPNSKYFDSRSTNENPKWDCARVQYLGQFKDKLSLQTLSEKYSSDELKVVKKGNRLSILPIQKKTAVELLKYLGELI